MASGTVRRRTLDGKVADEPVVELGVDPMTVNRKHTTRTFRPKKEEQAWLTSTHTEVDSGDVRRPILTDGREVAPVLDGDLRQASGTAHRIRGRETMNKQHIAKADDAAERPLAYSVEDAARLLSIGRTLGWKMVRSGELRSVRLRGRVLVPLDAIEELLRGDTR
jgi:excisionase family DNA binding protein